MEHDYCIDIKGLCCSAPVIRLSREFKTLPEGAIVLLISDKCSMLNDIPAYCRMTQNELLQSEAREGAYYFWVKKHAP